MPAHYSPFLNPRMEPYVTNVFAEVTALAKQFDAISLGQGAPDFNGPQAMLDVAANAILSHAPQANQYPPTLGLPSLRRAIVQTIATDYGLHYDANTECMVTTGATEALSATLLSLLSNGDEIITLEPFFDAYAALSAHIGAPHRVSPVRSRDASEGFRVDFEQFESLINNRTKIILLNSPHNPTGAVLNRQELEQIAQLAIKHDLIVVTDEVYEYLTYGDAVHIPIATLPGMRERTVRISSAAKTFNVTGWKVGWVTAVPDLLVPITTLKQHETFASGAPLQPAIAHALQHEFPWVARLKELYEGNRDRLAAALHAGGMQVYPSEGTYFLLADARSLGFDDGREFCRELTQRVGVAAVPVGALAYSATEWGSLVRFSFAKKPAVLAEAILRLGDLPQLAR